MNKTVLEADFKSKHKTYKRLIQRVEPTKSKPAGKRSVFDKYASLQSRITQHQRALSELDQVVRIEG